MPTLSMTDQLTALEVMRRSGNQDGFHIVELLSQTNEILKDMPVLEANDGTVPHCGAERTVNTTKVLNRERPQRIRSKTVLRCLKIIASSIKTLPSIRAM